MHKQPSWALPLWIVALLAALPAAAVLAQDGSSATEGARAVGEPTEEQIRAAYAAALEDLNARSKAELGVADAARLLIVLDGLSKLGCRELSREGIHYDCRVERRIRRGDRKATTDVVQLWLSYEDAHWVAR